MWNGATRRAAGTGAALALAATLAACAQQQTQTSTGDVMGMRWTATLSAPAAAGAPTATPGATRDSTMRDTTMGGMTAGALVVGSAVVSPAANGQTQAVVMLANGTPGASYPWHVHRGRCGSDQGVVGDASAYTPITIGQDGRGQATVTLAMATPTAGDYFVNVHASPAQMNVIVSCGNLTLNGAR